MIEGSLGEMATTEDNHHYISSHNIKEEQLANQMSVLLISLSSCHKGIQTSRNAHTTSIDKGGPAFTTSKE